MSNGKGLVISCQYITYTMSTRQRCSVYKNKTKVQSHPVINTYVVAMEGFAFYFFRTPLHRFIKKWPNHMSEVECNVQVTSDVQVATLCLVTVHWPRKDNKASNVALSYKVEERGRLIFLSSTDGSTSQGYNLGYETHSTGVPWPNSENRSS